MKTYNQVLEETEGKTRIENEMICKSIILEIERLYNTYFPVKEFNVTYGIMLQTILFDPYYANYRSTVLQMLDEYKVDERNIVSRFLITINQTNLPPSAKEEIENSFKNLPFCKHIEKLKDGYIIETTKGNIEAYQLSKITKNQGLYKLLNKNILQSHCHEAVDICKGVFPKANIVTSELNALFDGIYYHSYFKTKNDAVIDVSTNTLYKNNTFDLFYNPKELQNIPSCKLDEYIMNLEDINNETRCKVLRLAIQNKIKNEQES